MNKSIITLIIALAAVCGGASAQQKQGKVPYMTKSNIDKYVVVDTSSVRIW